MRRQCHRHGHRCRGNYSFEEGGTARRTLAGSSLEKGHLPGKGAIILKGVMTVEDAKLAVEAGAAESSFPTTGAEFSITPRGRRKYFPESPRR